MQIGCKQISHFWSYGLATVALILAVYHSDKAHGQTRSQVYGGTLTQQTQTAFFRGDIGWQTYESEGVDSKDTSTAFSYTIGGFAGEDRQLGVMADIEETDTTFALNNTRVANSWRDLVLQYRLGFLYPMVIATSSEVKIWNNNEEFIHMFASGFGAGVSVNVPITTKILIQADTRAINSNSAHDKNGHAVSMGRRHEAELNASIDVVEKYVDLIMGYKYRSYSLNVDDSTSVETQSTPFGGLRFGVYF